MEYLGEQGRQSGETAALDGDWPNGMMDGGQLCLLGIIPKQTQPIKITGKVENASFFVTVLRHMSTSFQPAAHGRRRSKSQSAVSTILNNLITCRAADTKDSVTELRHNCIKKFLPTDTCSRIDKVDPSNQGEHQTERKSFFQVGDSMDSSEFTDLKPLPATYRPLSFPTCSLCGKAFKPVNLHSHMKSCRGMKILAKNASNASAKKDNTSSWRSTTSSDRVTDQTSLLCH